MTADETYEYFTQFWLDENGKRLGGLWRRRGDDLEHVSVTDWAWHPLANPLDAPHPNTVEQITEHQAAELLEDRQRFVQYWVSHDSGRPMIYRRLTSPEITIDEVFGLKNRWIPTGTIREFRAAGPHQKPGLVPIDAETAERTIRETRDISGVTRL
ncbi:hypothetical protein [Amycolatopsis sp. NPDC051128]|uniref:hypothetical protein n=1 Tax=Amycolatopsis sp. NPDC051128 TaxID=3155412 RepID=UPI0034418C27